ncbi:hypothetical protein ASE40_04630 [Flavobacterium sp. Root935]|uniref:hypothetical protein n=1 Tax=Flavobacterium sp. Root935 TaxID=1736610 RepID=UPI00070B5115|nr:hypothetical protein [Flavobacterium sp. Root935]KRD63075.1 hypothetical protein ASE40_04630 [Flavobacterium sp. Root935]
MKKYILIIASILLLSCNDSAKKDTKNRTENIKKVKKELKPFFDSDQIEHYYLNFSEDDFFKLIRKDNKTEKELELSDLFSGYYPDSIPTEDFEKILLKHNYKKSKLSIKQQKKIESVFSEKDLPIPDAAACIAEYRDIFIFKKRGRIIGISKICFVCNRFQIIGSKIDVSVFGFPDELDKLNKIVRKEEKP